MSASKIHNTAPVFEGKVIIEASQASDQLHNFHAATISYCLYGSLDQPVSIVMGGISADAMVKDTISQNGQLIKGWWDRSVGPGKSIDLQSNTVLGINYLPDKQLASEFFASNKSVSTQDQARLIKYLLAQLGIEKIQAFVGSSYGGMVALAFAELYPDAVEKLIVLCASAQANARTTAFRSIQRSIIGLAPDENKDAAVGLARSLGMIVYRSHREFEQRFSNQPVLQNNKWTFPVTDYIYSRGQSLAQNFSAERFSLLSESCDLHHVNPAKITADTLLIGFDTDDIVKPQEIVDLSEKLGGESRYKIVQSIYGHDAFIVEQHLFANQISAHLAK